MLKSSIFALCGTLLSSSVSASVVVGKVTRLVTRSSDGLQIAEIGGARSAKPACATYDYLIIRDEKSDAGKAQYAMLMAAFLADKQITAEGSDRCLRWPDGEDIESITFVK